jgi:5-methylcytosine-specific restriction enzyme subunit McrC
LDAFYSELAKVLSLRVLDRGRRGFYRAYLARMEQLPYVTGRLDIDHLVQRPWSSRPRCHYEEHTADIDENQILSWTLHHVLRSGVCSQRVLPTIRRAYRVTRGFATLRPYSAEACVGRLYNRLNDDYQPMHALCRFFLEHTGPNHEIGDRTVLPFLVDMARLYELFVAEWLKQHLPGEVVYVKPQDRVTLGTEQTLRLDIDLTLYAAKTHQALCVLDTKYKAPETPSHADIYQVVAYAEVKGCSDAILVYPAPLDRPLDQRLGKIRVRSLVFSIDGGLEKAGQTFVRELGAALGQNGRLAGQEFVDLSQVRRN